MRAGTAATAQPTAAGRVEARAIRLLVAGDRPRDIALVTGLTVQEVEQLQAETPGARPGRVKIAAPAEEVCFTPRCGKPRAGRPPLGWVKVTVSGRGDALWHCGWACARRYIQRHEVEQ